MSPGLALLLTLLLGWSFCALLLFLFGKVIDRLDKSENAKRPLDP